MKGQGPGCEGVKFGQEPAQLDFLLALGEGRMPPTGACFSCWDGAAFMPQSPRVTPASLLSAITIPLEGCVGSNRHFRLEQPGPCPRAGQPCRQQTLASA